MDDQHTLKISAWDHRVCIFSKIPSVLHEIEWSVRLQILTTTSMKMTVSWDVALCDLVKIYWRRNDGDIKHLRNVSRFLLNYRTQRTERQSSSFLESLFYALATFQLYIF